MIKMLRNVYFILQYPIYIFAPIYVFTHMIWVPFIAQLGIIPAYAISIIFFYIAWIFPFSHFELKQRILGTTGALNYLQYQNFLCVTLIVICELHTTKL